MTQHFHIAILGSGFGGLGMAASLKQAGIEDFVVFEKASSVGGVWRDNTYPGAACDTQAHVYCYTYFPHLRVPKMYAGQEDILNYQHQLRDAFGLGLHLKYNAEVVSARWNEEAAYWEITLRTGEQYSADFFVPAWGQLNAPKIPSWPGQEKFQGASFHSAQWRHDVDLTGKKVISIGSAASAVQYIPEIAKVTGHLDVFQRSANYILPREQITFSAEELDTFEQHPETFEASRQSIHEFREAGFERTRNSSEDQAKGQQEALDHLHSVVQDHELRAMLTPDYDFGCKRILRTSDFYPALLRDNVSLVAEPIDYFTETGIVTSDGILHEADVIIYGTGFHSQNFQGDLQIVGRNGITLKERWGHEDAEAYLGMSVDGFPNMFLMYGPNTNLNHNSIVTMLEIQQRYVVDAIQKLSSVKGASAEVRTERLRSFNDNLQQEMEASSFSSDCSSWYKNSKGKVINNWSGTVEEYRILAHDFNQTDYYVRSLPPTLV